MRVWVDCFAIGYEPGILKWKWVRDYLLTCYCFAGCAAVIVLGVSQEAESAKFEGRLTTVWYPWPLVFLYEVGYPLYTS